MKKQKFLPVVMAVIVAIFLLSSCATYMCPTYSKKTEKKEKIVQERV